MSDAASAWEQQLAARLAQRHADNLYRSRRTLQSEQGARVVIDGKSCLNFCSNDYLGLASHPRLREAVVAAVSRYGVGSGASHLVCGHSELHAALEQQLAEFCGRERALLFSTGYMANLAAVTALVDDKDAVFEDRLNHASLLDAGLLSGARFQRFLHNDLANLESRLARSIAAKKLIVVDGVFSMDGDVADLPGLAALAKRYSAWLMVDDAHGFGVLGSSGGGTPQHFGLNTNDVPVLMGTLGKAAGSFGAFVAGSELLIETLIQFARPYIYTTALPPAVAAASLASLAVQREESWRRDHLQQLIKHFRDGALGLGLSLMPSSSAIQPLLVGDAARAVAISEKLLAAGVLVSAIRPPTVPAGTARLRITLTAAHSIADVDQLLDALQRAVA
jgi:8-amino-7-oxononanoate synthase